jgi:Family of unknown function (DUF6785)
VLPLQLTDPRDDLFRRPLFWLGFAVPAVLQSLLALHEWWPAVPAFQLKAFDVKPLLFTSPPWSAMPDLSIGFYPIAVGIAYFVPSSVSFSCWFFWLVTKLSSAAGAIYGLDTGNTAAARQPRFGRAGCGGPDRVAAGGGRLDHVRGNGAMGNAAGAPREGWSGGPDGIAPEGGAAGAPVDGLACGGLRGAMRRDDDDGGDSLRAGPRHGRGLRRLRAQRGDLAGAGGGGRPRTRAMTRHSVP